MEIIPLDKKITFDHIIDNLYLGDLESASIQHIVDNDIQIVFNISNCNYEENQNVEYYHYNIDDESSADIIQFFEHFITLVKQNYEKKILVHCQNSVSRSVTLVLAYLISKGYSLIGGYEYIKTRRSQYTLPNRGFLKQLSQHEVATLGGISVDPITMYKNIRK
jgi:protein-tyrosine phosphatase